MTTLSGWQVDTSIFGAKPRGWRFWQRPGCAHCGARLTGKHFDIPRHLARELLEQGCLGGEAEVLFHSTRDDLGWMVRGMACESCQKFAPTSLLHRP